jgi:hypothetical protein
MLRRLYNLKCYPNRYQATEEDERNNNVIITIFKSEPITSESFVQNNLEYLDFPLWLAEMVDRGEITASHASILNDKKVAESKHDSVLI